MRPSKNFEVKHKSSQKGGAEFSPKPGNPVKQELLVQILNAKTLYGDGKTALEHARAYSDFALLTLSRGGGEGYDFDPVDLRLVDSEAALIRETCKYFDKVILLLNTANTLEMGWLKDFPQIKAVLWVGFPGTAGNLALGDILCGDVNPSGHLSDTWAASNLTAPAANNFRQLEADGTWKKESFHYANAPEKKGYFVHYSEGIYVGYRYFETRWAVDKYFDYGKAVVWPFGHGLSYTEFAQKILSFDGKTLTAQVKNIGSRAGRCAVQCYVSLPYTGKLEKSAVLLAGFEKTSLLCPGGEALLTLDIPQRRLASFDMGRGAWVLEAGIYTISLCADAHHRLDSIDWALTDEILLPGTTALFPDAQTDTLNRDFPPNHRAFTGPVQEDFTADPSVLNAPKFSLPTDAELGLTEKPICGRDSGLKLSQMQHIPKTAQKWDAFVQQLTLAELCDLCGNGAWQTRPIPRLGIPGTKATDGSTSMEATIFSALVMGTRKAGITWPCPSVLAANFDKK